MCIYIYIHIHSFICVGASPKFLPQVLRRRPDGAGPDPGLREPGDDICIYIYIYIYRSIDREREREKERDIDR